MREDLKLKILTFLACKFLNFTCKTIKWKILGEENFRKFKEENKSVIFATWHGRMLIPIYCLKGEEIYGIVSPSRDGEYFSQLFSRFGYKTIRGSTKRKSISAVLSGVKILKEGKFLAITPDGPRGPKEKVQIGVIYFSSKTNTPIIPIGASCKHKKFLNTWDNSLIPLPGGIGILIFGNPLYVPSKIDISQMQKYAEFLERELKNLNQLADEFIKG
jgi:lysophospholipid acyltransferase (LPLAT)-like uncharacterized protein